ncbi:MULTISPECIES: hypothetical protein [unclassified Alcanivorax]|jgi:hypothetical protein|uniref:hypothetical protein n=1 Tax=unclassified Alcanivorax TaxID=2638842 RepID=UPI0004B2512B|nr:MULTISPECIES: hypothetical protein [unclassified Alcanivorax]
MVAKLKGRLLHSAPKRKRAEILKKMGYSHPDPSHLSRLDRVLNDPDWGLLDGVHDSRHSDEEFFRSFCSVMEVDAQTVDTVINITIKAHKDRIAAFKPYLWVDTGFTRKNQPIFAMAAMEQFRHLYFQSAFLSLPMHLQIDEVRQRIREHMADTGGELPMWGKIQQYWFFNSIDKAILLDVNGDVIGEREGPVSNSSSCSLR